MPRVALAETLVHPGPLPDEVLQDIGATAFGPHLELVREPDSYPDAHLTYREKALISYMSRGYSIGSVAVEFSAHPQLMINRLDNIQGKFGVRDTPALVGVVIHEGQLKVPDRRDEALTQALDRTDLFFLNCVRNGLPNGTMAKQLHWSTSRVKDAAETAISKVGGRNRAHGMRRCFELGVFTGAK